MVTYYDPRKRTRITVTTPQERAKRKKAAKQFAQNSKSALLVQMMQMLLKMNQTKEKAEQNYLTTPVDKWTEIDRAKNELVALGKGVNDIVKGIKALDTDLSLMRQGLGADGLTNFNKFLAGDVSPVVTEVVKDMGVDPIISTSDIATDTRGLTFKDVKTLLAEEYDIRPGNEIYNAYFRKSGLPLKRYENVEPYSIFEEVKQLVEESEFDFS